MNSREHLLTDTFVIIGVGTFRCRKEGLKLIFPGRTFMPGVIDFPDIQVGHRLYPENNPLAEYEVAEIEIVPLGEVLDVHIVPIAAVPEEMQIADPEAIASQQFLDVDAPVGMQIGERASEESKADTPK